MRICYHCGRLTSGQPVFCNFCGRSYNIKLCPRLHPNPRGAEACSKCGLRDLSTPQEKLPLWFRPLLFLFGLLPGVADAIHGDLLPPSIEPQAFAPLLKLERADDGAFILKAGIYEAYLESYSLEPYDPGMARGSAFFPAPIKGRRAKVISDVLKHAELHPDVQQGYIQNLLGLTVLGTDLEKMPAPTQQAAAKILPKETLLQLQGAAQAKKLEKTLLDILGRRIGKDAKAAKEITGVISKEKQLDQQYGITATAADLKTSSAAGAAPGVALRGTWAQMPGGFYVRYLPDGYGKTRLQVIVPEAAMEQADAKKPLAFDPTQYLAVHTGTPPQRLGITLRPVGGR